jgi:hypothetical protein
MNDIKIFSSIKLAVVHASDWIETLFRSNRHEVETGSAAKY